jgi:hypothetical protein
MDHRESIEFDVAGGVALAEVERNEGLRCDDGVIGNERVNRLLADEADISKARERGRV